MNSKIFNLKGETSKDIEINTNIFDINKIQNQSMFDSVLAENASNRQGTHSTKTKGEVSGGGKKPWAQKHTGNARQGSTRNPQWRKGGVAFGPKPNRNYEIKLNKKVSKAALRSALTIKINENNFLIVNEFKIEKYSTKGILEIIKSLKISARKILFITHDENLVLSKSAANIKNVYVSNIKNTSTRDILNVDFVVLEEKALKHYEEVLG